MKKKQQKKKHRFKRKGIFFSVDFNSIDTNDVLDIHRYLIELK